MSWLEENISTRSEDSLYNAYRHLFVLKTSLFGNITRDQAEDAVKLGESHIYYYRVKFVIIPVKINKKWKFFQRIVEAQHWIKNEAITEKTAYYSGMCLFESVEDLVIKRLREGCIVEKWKLIS